MAGMQAFSERANPIQHTLSQLPLRLGSNKVSVLLQDNCNHIKVDYYRRFPHHIPPWRQVLLICTSCVGQIICGAFLRTQACGKSGWEESVVEACRTRCRHSTAISSLTGRAGA